MKCLFLAWLMENPDRGALNKEAFCKLCNTGLRAQKTDLLKHSNTGTHRGEAFKFQNQRKLPSVGLGLMS